MTMTTDINDIRELEERRRTAMLRSDVPELEGLFAEQLAYTHSNGEVDTMAEYIAKLDNHYYRYHTLSFLDQDIRIVGHAALVTGRMTGEVTIDGQLRKLNSRTTVVWIRHDDRWQMLTFQSTPIPSF
ncbi:nuclear transport factor 2 family protein [Tardiphaga sp. P9-11]|uniref:nuclear transport factor 2 family protein n=1 Tax=Tardiphaga sp. P9-11 TaxID=2024614 RepID=UPI0011F12CBB|nr:nuclear transport factor 2 family protein [Tardiphaga sp. P9-11]KAA0073243.1 nuclear transport factor 2 family protein [Tardiphaga sp. P9-11]